MEFFAFEKKVFQESFFNLFFGLLFGKVKQEKTLVPYEIKFQEFDYVFSVGLLLCALWGVISLFLTIFKK